MARASGRKHNSSGSSPRAKTSPRQLLFRAVRAGAVLGLALFGSSMMGCTALNDLGDYANLRNSWFDPSQVGRFDKGRPFFHPTPVTWPILDSLAVNDPPALPWPNSRLPTPADLVVSTKPYVLGPGDVLTVSVFQLVVPDQESVQTREINSQGEINLDFIGTVKAAGLTAKQLQQRIIATLIQSGQMSPPGPHQPGPQVNVDVTQAKSRVFSLIGAAARPGTYNITSPYFRLLDALALAGDMNVQPGMRYLYVIRASSAATPATSGKATAATGSASNSANSPFSALTNIVNQVQSSATQQQKMTASQQQAEQNLLQQALEPTTQQGATHYVYVNHHWEALPGPAPKQPENAGTAKQTQQAPAQPMPNFAAGNAKPQLVAGANETVIRIPLKKLREGDPLYNIVIHSGDIINIPPVKPTYYYVMGNVSRPGVYTLSGEHITLKMAVAAAGNLSAFAIPRRCELTRRIGRHQEMTVFVNLQSIFNGQEPDIFLKPNDVMNVGSDLMAQPLAVFRNGFQAAYGFGFTYDRNYYITPIITGH